jgi:hypothetical protein
MERQDDKNSQFPINIIFPAAKFLNNKTVFVCQVNNQCFGLPVAEQGVVHLDHMAFPILGMKNLYVKWHTEFLVGYAEISP